MGFEGRGEQEVPGITPHLQGNYQKPLWQCLSKLITLAVWLARPTDDASDHHDSQAIDLRQVEQDVFYLGAKPSLGI